MIVSKGMVKEFEMKRKSPIKISSDAKSYWMFTLSSIFNQIFNKHNTATDRYYKKCKESQRKRKEKWILSIQQWNVLQLYMLSTSIYFLYAFVCTRPFVNPLAEKCLSHICVRSNFLLCCFYRRISFSKLPCPRTKIRAQ